MVLLGMIEDKEEDNQSESKIEPYTSEDTEMYKVLCKLCGRTSSNGIRCLGMCVAESDY